MKKLTLSVLGLVFGLLNTTLVFAAQCSDKCTDCTLISECEDGVVSTTCREYCKKNK